MTSHNTNVTQYFTFIQSKGGTGKTTACLNIAGWLTRLDKKVLVIDMDPKADATRGLGIDAGSVEGTIQDILNTDYSIKSIILESDSGIYCAPQYYKIKNQNNAYMKNSVKLEYSLRQELSSIQEQFHYILFDVPSYSYPLIKSTINISDNIVIPVDGGVFSYEALFNIKKILSSLKKRSKKNGHQNKTKFVKIISKSWPESLIYDCLVERQIKKLITQFVKMMGYPKLTITPIPHSKKVLEAQFYGLPISHFAPFSKVARTYRKIAHELIRT